MSAEGLLEGALYVAMALALAAGAVLGAQILRGEWTRAPKRARAWAAAALLAVFAAAVFASRGTPLRAGRHNEHSFAFMATRPFPGADLPQLFSERDASPRVLLSLYERLAGRSFGAMRIFQRLLWGLCGLLTFLALWRSGAGVWAAGTGAALLFLNFHAVLTAHSFSPETPALLFLLAGVYALTRLDTERDPRLWSRVFLWFWAIDALALTSRFEFSAALWMGLAVVLWRRRERPRGAVLWAMGGILALQASWLYFIATRWHHKLAPGEWAPAAYLLRSTAQNLRYHVLGANLSELWGGLNHPLAAVSVLGLAPLALFVLAWRRPSSPARFWAPFLLPWIAFFGLIHIPLTLHPISHSRHHLMVFVPFALLFAALSGAFVEAAAAGAGRALARGTLAVFLASYAAVNLKRAAAYAQELRTSDLEWQFLVESRRAWPAGCAAVYPYRDTRRDILEKYFPRSAPGPLPDDVCLLLYRSPRHQVFVFMDRPQAPELFDVSLKAWRETSFEHRYYTDWHGPWQWDKMEAVGPVPVRIGFYRISARRWERMQKEALEGPPHNPVGPMPQRWIEYEDMLADMSYERSLEACYKRRLSLAVARFARRVGESAGRWRPPESALDCFDVALRQARERREKDDEISLLAARAAYLHALGRWGEARADLAAGLRLRAAAGLTGGRGALSLRHVARWVGAPGAARREI